MNTRTTHVIVCALLALAGLGGVYLGIEYSGWVLAVGLLAILNRA